MPRWRPPARSRSAPRSSTAPLLCGCAPEPGPAQDGVNEGLPSGQTASHPAPRPPGSRSVCASAHPAVHGARLHRRAGEVARLPGLQQPTLEGTDGQGSGGGVVAGSGSSGQDEGSSWGAGDGVTSLPWPQVTSEPGGAEGEGRPHFTDVNTEAPRSEATGPSPARGQRTRSDGLRRGLARLPGDGAGQNRGGVGMAGGGGPGGGCAGRGGGRRRTRMGASTVGDTAVPPGKGSHPGKTEPTPC